MAVQREGQMRTLFAGCVWLCMSAYDVREDCLGVMLPSDLHFWYALVAASSDWSAQVVEKAEIEPACPYTPAKNRPYLRFSVRVHTHLAKNVRVCRIAAASKLSYAASRQPRLMRAVTKMRHTGWLKRVIDKQTFARFAAVLTPLLQGGELVVMLFARHAASPGCSVRDAAFLLDALREWGPSVYNLAMLQTGSRHDADDVYQDVFLRLATSTTRFNGPEHLKAWLLRVTLNRCRDLRRATWFRRVDSLEEHPDAENQGFAAPTCGMQAHESAEDEALRAVEVASLRRAVAQLKPKLREVVYLHYAESLDCNAIAQLVGARPSTVRTRLQRARDQLRVLLGGSEYVE